MNNQMILYKSQDGKLSFDVKLDHDTVWLTQAQMAELFKTTKQNISLHINNIFKLNELNRNRVVKDFLTTAKDGKNYNVIHYSLDMIISVGYRINSIRGTQFRIWATNILRNHLLNGYSVNNHKLENIEKKIDYLLAKDQLRDQESKQLKDYKNLISKLLKPNPIINKIYLDTKPLLEANQKNTEELKYKFEELNQILKDIEQKLPTTSDLKPLITNIKTLSTKAKTDPKSQNKLLKFLTELGDKESTLHKLLTTAGITQNLLKKAIEIGHLLIKHLPI